MAPSDDSETREDPTMVSAYILVQTEVGKAGQVTEQIVEAEDLDSLAKSVVMPMQEIEGITRTLTCPVLQF
jgi:hypothetical protein